jgi:lipopolysaccharide/colanic/teichoic acid biosynthesis glycosyltransferase
MSPAKSSTIARKPHHTKVAPAQRMPPADLPRPSAYFGWKAVFDRTLAALLLAPGLPIIGLLVALVRLTSRGPGIFRQVRVGQHGRKFMMYKIRTMRSNAEAASGPVWTQHHDPRVTLVGRVLRKFHLDELPQLLNVVKGEMSLVGPRPERPEFVHVLSEAIPNYQSRLAVRPGVTGLAQLNLPPDSDLHSVRRKLVLDCEYIRQAGPWLDLRLFACTGLRMLKVPEGWSLRLFGLHRDVTVPMILEDPSGTGGNGGGNGSNGGNGGNGGNGADHAVVTPTSIQAEIAHALTEVDGSPPGHQKHPGKRLDGGSGPSKPR